MLIFQAWDFPEKPVSLNNASHETMCAEQRGFHRKKCSGVTSGSPFPLMSLWISLHYVSLLCCCPVENTWTQGTNAIVCPWLRRKRWLLSLPSPRCCFCWSFGALDVKSHDNPLLERRIPVRSAGPCSCWAHTRKEGRGGLTDGERISRLRPPPPLRPLWKILTFQLASAARKDAKSFFSAGPVGI